jgi:hypothetical protein
MVEIECPHEDCICLLVGNEDYCCLGCKQGRGCRHAECDCSNVEHDFRGRPGVQIPTFQ